jgi:hypothetical protein
MQLIFAEVTPWHTPWIGRVLPIIEEIARRHARRTVFTRFLPPADPAEMPGSWQRYYRRWRELTLEQLDPALLELVPPLARLVPPATVIDKHVYSPFVERAPLHHLRDIGADALVISGAETDVACLRPYWSGRFRLSCRYSVGCDLQLGRRDPRRVDDALSPAFFGADRDRHNGDDPSQLVSKLN